MFDNEKSYLAGNAPALLRKAEAPAAPRESFGFLRGLVAPARSRSGATADWEAGYKAGYSDGMLAGLEEALGILRGAIKKGELGNDKGRTEGHAQKPWKGKKKAGRRQG